MSEQSIKEQYYRKRCQEYVAQCEQTLGHKLKACIQTLGCQMNARDSEKLTAILRSIGYEITDDVKADFIIFNTCTVRENANLKVYGRLGFLKKEKKENPQMKIALCGCMMQEPQVVEKIKKSYRNVDLIFGTHNLYKFTELLWQQIETNHMVVDVWQEAKEIVEDLPSERKYSFKAGVNIMYGCNNFCSYCIVPYVRGRERSRKPEEIIKECQYLADDGVVELMLLGQNVNSYNKTVEGGMSFAQLLQEIEKIDGIKRIRFMTSHPKDLSDELIDVIAASKKICHQIHLPLQSGSSRILKAMNRKYTKEKYLDLVERIREKIPDISLSTDLIVGFPGETHEDILETIDCVRKAKYDNAYTFIYSKRSNTPAATMENQVDEETANRHFNELLDVVHEVTKLENERHCGEIEEVLFEELNEQDSSMVTGRLESGTVVHVHGGRELIGQIKKVKLNVSKGFYYMGEVVD